MSNPFRILKVVDKVIAERDKAKQIAVQLVDMIENNQFGLNREEWEQLDKIKAELGCADETKDGFAK